MSHEEILAAVDSLKSAPIAFEALWDGDSTGWFIYLSAITKDLQSHRLGAISEGSDIRLFNGQVPPWPEAIAAKQLGSDLAERFDAEFYFPSPDRPEDDFPSWIERSEGYPCRCCGILLLQRDPCPWRGVCHHCHLREEREKREAQWTPEQRAGARCHICGDPASHELRDRPACADCFAKYEVFSCQRCACVVLIARTVEHSFLCTRCETQQLIDALSAEQLDEIQNAAIKGGLGGIRSAMKVIGCSLYEAKNIVGLLGEAESQYGPKKT